MRVLIDLFQQFISYMIGIITHLVWGYKQVKISMEFFGLINKIVDLRALASIQMCIDVGTILVTLICLMVSSESGISGQCPGGMISIVHIMRYQNRYYIG